eukprot:1137068-Pelagomonas_calceolata.AAC.4
MPNPPWASDGAARVALLPQADSGQAETGRHWRSALCLRCHPHQPGRRPGCRGGWGAAPPWHTASTQACIHSCVLKCGCAQDAVVAGVQHILGILHA